MLRRLALPVLALAAVAHAQTATVAGTVRDDAGAPLAGASVYLSGTARGTSADAEGRYEIADVPAGAYRVVASLVGYGAATHDLRLPPHARRVVNLTLTEATLDLGRVRVEAERDRRWERRFQQFQRALLGESENAEQTAILNPEVLDFRSRWGTLRATARAPLVIENRALGYRLVYDLHAFQASASRIEYDGDEYFTPLAPSSPDEAARWDAARARAYRGSLRHLLRTLFDDDAEPEGFGLRIVRSDPIARRPFAPSAPISTRRLLRVEPTGWGRLRIPGRLEVVYRGEPEERAYLDSEWYQGNGGRPQPVQRSTVFLNGGFARIDPQGTPEDPMAVVTTGHMAFERLSDLVPEEYVPSEPNPDTGL